MAATKTEALSLPNGMKNANRQVLFLDLGAIASEKSVSCAFVTHKELKSLFSKDTATGPDGWKSKLVLPEKDTRMKTTVRCTL